jgi:hypothetical protein
VKWIYICSYCSHKTLDEKKDDSIRCEYCEHHADRLESTSERLTREREVLELERQTMVAALPFQKRLRWYNRWLYT